jgi:hypothetical protein
MITGSAAIWTGRPATVKPLSCTDVTLLPLRFPDAGILEGPHLPSGSVTQIPWPVFDPAAQENLTSTPPTMPLLALVTIGETSADQF